MEDAPGAWEVLSSFSLDLVWSAALVAAGIAYVVGARRLSATAPRVPHPRWRTACFVAALVLVGLAVMSPLHTYGDELLWVNFSGFLVLTMLAPPLFVLGAPLTLAFRVASPQGRRRLRHAYRSRILGWLTFPINAWLLFAAVTYAWQFSHLTEIAAREWAVRDLQQVTLLLVGLFFWYEALAVDPVKWRMALPFRVLFVGVEMVHKGLFGGMFLSLSSPFHDQFVANTPSWAPSPMTDQRMAILILWIGGNLIFLVAIVCLISAWLRYESRNQHRVDRRLRLAREAQQRRHAAIDQVFTRGI